MKYIFAFVTVFACSTLFAQKSSSPLDELPDYIRQVTYFGERADWSSDGKRILFLEKTFGDVYEIEVETGIIRPMTHHFFHEGFVRALYLANGDILLSGAREFDSKDAWKSRDARNTELWVLKADLSAPPAPLGVHCKEGPAVSRTEMRIAWALGSAIYVGEIDDEGDKPKLKNWKPLFQSSELPSPAKGWDLETQNFDPINKDVLYFYAFGGQFGYSAEVLSYNIKEKTFTNFSKSPKTYDEAEGIFPNGLDMMIESNRHRIDSEGMKEFLTLDIYKLKLDESGDVERVTYFNDNPNYKASNPVVSDDGKFMAFHYAITSDEAGRGRGILVLDIKKWDKAKKK